MDDTKPTLRCTPPVLLVIAATHAVRALCRSVADDAGMLLVEAEIPTAWAVAARRPPSVIVLPDVLLAWDPIWFRALAEETGAMLVPVSAVEDVPESVRGALSVAAE